jgi:hypothetical protein
MRGDGAEDRLGASIAPAGDVDGDGNDDVVVGAPFNNSTDTRSGAAYLFTGPVEDGEYDADDADLTLQGEGRGDWAGYSVASGDVNGDGNDDIIVGAPLHEEASDKTGAVYVVYGAEDLSGTMNLSDADVKLTGAGDGDQFGFSVAAVDTNGDGTDAVVVGAPRNDGASEDAGAAYAFEIDGGVMLSAGDADATLHGEGAGDRAGQAVAAAGDVNNDSAEDVLIGAPFNNSTATNAGAAYAVTELDGAASLSDATKMTGDGTRDLAGWAVSDAGDVNGDGVDDVVVGAPFNDTTSVNAGAAYVVHGSDSLLDEIDLTNAATSLRGEDDGDRAGWSVSSAGSGDVTCDEFDDVLVGAPFHDASGTDSGSAYLVYGTDDPAENRNLDTAEAKLSGESEDDRAGVAVSDVNDTSGDGNEDIAVGAPRNDSDVENGGAAYIVNGQCPVEGEEEPEEEDTTEEPTDTETTTETEKTTETTEKTTETTEEPPEDTTEEPPEDTTEEPPEEPEPPDVGVTPICPDGNVEAAAEVTLNNPEAVDYPVTVELEVEGEVVGEVTFEEGDDTTKTVELALATGVLAAGTDVNVRVNGELQGDLEFTIQCPPPEEPQGDVNINVTCAEQSAEGEFLLTVDVTGEDADQLDQVTVVIDGEATTLNLDADGHAEFVFDSAAAQAQIDVHAGSDASGELIASTTVDLTLLGCGVDVGIVDVGNGVECTVVCPGNKILVNLFDNDGEASFTVSITGINEPDDQSGTVEVTATIENTGDQSGTQNIELINGDDQLDSQEVSLDAGQSDEVTLTWDTEGTDADDYPVEVVSDDERDTVTLDSENQEQSNVLSASEDDDTEREDAAGDDAENQQANEDDSTVDATADATVGDEEEGGETQDSGDGMEASGDDAEDQQANEDDSTVDATADATVGDGEEEDDSTVDATVNATVGDEEEESDEDDPIL